MMAKPVPRREGSTARTRSVGMGLEIRSDGWSGASLPVGLPGAGVRSPRSAGGSRAFWLAEMLALRRTGRYFCRMAGVKKLFLFDIDGTLLLTGRAGEHALRLAFQERFGVEDDLSSISFAGSTDGAIARQMFGAHAIPPTPENSEMAFMPASISSPVAPARPPPAASPR